MLPAAGMLLAAGCTASTPPTPSTTSTSTAPQSISSTVAAAPAPRSVAWFDLDVGDCLADPPPTDPNVVTVAVVDCSTPHRAEVYRRAPLAVNTAVVDVATRKCGEGFTAYTGEPVGSARFAVTYLIDSNQNRTASNPEPSTVICLLQAPDGGPLTSSARR